MIALPSIAFGGFSGSAKDVTARQVGGRSILTCRTWPTGPSTNAQVARRASLKKISKSWQLLTNDQRLAWDRLAEGATGITVLGQKAKISGLNLFVRLNSNLVMAGGAMRNEAPIGLDDVPLLRFGAMYVNSSAVRIEQIDEPDSDLRLIVKMSGAQSVGVSSGWSKTVVVSSDTETDWGELDLTDAFADVLGTNVVDGKKYFVEMYWVDSVTGFAGQITQIAGIAGPDPIYGTGGGTNGRAIVRVRDWETPQGSFFKNFEYELSHGSLLATIKGEYGYRQSLANSYVDLDETQAARFPDSVGYYLGRGNYGNNWSISYLKIETGEFNGKPRLGITPYNDRNNYGVVMFDIGTPVSL